MRPQIHVLILLFVLAPCRPAWSQTEVKTHPSPVFQIYPREAARVLAWLRNREKPEIARIEAAEDAGRTRIRWLDRAGKTIREKTVAGADAATKPGPDFFRDTLRDLAGDDWRIDSKSPDNSRSAFWQGADLGGMSRTQTLIAAGKLLQDEPKLDRPADAARLAGLLAHGAVPSLADRREIDSLLIARAAAWTAVAEARLREPLNAAWTPILFLAGEEADAAGRWKAIAPRSKLKSEAGQFWNAMLPDAPTLDRFTAAARRENASWAMPLLMRYAGNDPRFFTPLAAILSATTDAAGRSRWHDYEPALEASGDPVAAGLIEKPAPWREPWQRVLQAFTPGEFDRADFAKVIADGKFWDTVKAAPKQEPPLIPVAFASADELLRACAEAERVPSPAPGRRAELSDEEIRGLGEAALAAAASPAPANPNAEAPAAIAPVPEFKTAGEAWDYFKKLGASGSFPDSPEDAMRRAREIESRQLAAADRIATQFPADPRRWEAQLFTLEVTMRNKLEAKGPLANFDEERKFLDSVQLEPDASAEAKAQAELMTIKFHRVNALEPHTLPPFHRRLSEFLEKHPRHPDAPKVAMLQLQLLELPGTQGADEILARIAALPNPAIAAMARGAADRRSRFAGLKKKPLALKAKAADGSEIDAEKLRGKVVLLDFWASWCGPCLAEAPAVVSIYEDLRARGFEIVGISLDEDEAAMKAAAEKHRMTWPQIFDGKGWKNEVAVEFGVQSIPSTWLFDKKGLLRQTGLRGDELRASIEQMLAE